MNLNDESEIQVPVVDELATLKARADLLNLSYHPSIGVDKLREKIAAHLAEDAGEAGSGGTEGAAEDEKPKPAVLKTKAETLGQKRARTRREAAALVRVRVTCMNPNKKEYEGEIITAGNAVVGTHKKYVPFNNEEGWHIPQIIFNVLNDRQCQIFITKKDAQNRPYREGKLIREFAIEVLPPLKPAELQELAQRQAMAKSID